MLVGFVFVSEVPSHKRAVPVELAIAPESITKEFWVPGRPLKGVEVPIPIVVVAIVMFPTLIKLANVEEAEADKPPKLEKPVTESPPANVEVASVEEELRA